MMREHLLMTVAFVFLAAEGRADPLECAARHEMVAMLAETFSEVAVSRGIEARGGLLEMFASEAGTWTLIVTTPQLVSCPVAAGVDYMQVDYNHLWDERG